LDGKTGLFRVYNNKKEKILIARNSSAEQLPLPDDGEEINSSEKTEETADNADDEPEPHRDEDDIASIDEVLNALDSAYKSDKNLQTKLNYIALKNLYKYTGQARLSGYDAEEIVSIVITKILESEEAKRRKWNKTKHPNIVNFIFMCIVSFIRNERKKTSSTTTPLYDIRETGLDVMEGEKNRYDKEKTVTPTVVYKNGQISENTNYDIASARNYREKAGEPIPDYEELISDLEKELENDEIAFFVLQEILNNCKSNQEIAGELGITVKDVENASKRIKRKLSHSKNKIK